LLNEARRSVKALRPVVNRPGLRAHLAVVRAALRQAAGDDGGALDDLARADRRLVQADQPRLAYEAARIRARAYRHCGREGESGRQARYAVAIAADHGWSHHARRTTVEFGGATGSHAGTLGRTQSIGADIASAGLQRQRLSALQQVSQAASRVLDPDRLARIALDETVRILGAERAFMFRYDADADRLVPHLGRDIDGHDLAELTNYSTTMVDRVRQTRQPEILTGNAEGAATGAQSAIVHGLRSIMVAPLELDGRLLGVVYLDSRVAKGIFTEDDVSILTAITNHIAVALETARAAQLEVAVATANQQRDVAEKLRVAMSFVSGSLDPDEVLARLLKTVAQMLRSDASWLVARDTEEPGTVTVRADLGRQGSDAIKPHGERFPLDTDPVLAALVNATAPSVGRPDVAAPATFAGVLPEGGSWLTVPLAIREDRVGLLLLTSGRPGAYDDAGSELAATLAGQGMVAYENARLFSTVRRLATTDALTGVANRRHFFELAEEQFVMARRSRTPLSAFMLDIDHFKRVNDTYGHLVGDEVIRTVARRMAGHGRQSDLVGRYGGEEFSMVVAAPDDEALRVAERIRREVVDAPVDTPAGPVPVSISVGVAHLRPDHDGDLSGLLDRADRGLYRAKEGGRNRVVAGP
jgi:diguanylate cyclase (GGDEF)-like protein